VFFHNIYNLKRRKAMLLVSVVVFICGAVELYYGAAQLGLLSSPAAPAVMYAVLIGCFFLIACIFATLITDYVVARRWGYNAAEKGRWEEHTGNGEDGFESAPGRGLRLFILFAFQIPTVYFLLLFLRS
jgi:hypothetical protein